MNNTAIEPCIAFAIYALSFGIAAAFTGLGISYVIQACRYYYYCYDDCRLDEDKSKEVIK